jgi:hypothetical protein
VLLAQHRRVEAQRAEDDEVRARLELVRPARAAQELGEPAGAPGADLGHVDLDAVGALEQQLDGGDGLDGHAPHLAAALEVRADPALGDPRQRELAADQGGHEQAEEGEERAQHRRVRLEVGAQQGWGPSFRALAAVARQPASVRARRQVTARRRTTTFPHALSPAASVRSTVAPAPAAVTRTASGA